MLNEILASALNQLAGLRYPTMRFPSYSRNIERAIRKLPDGVRFRTLALALATIEREGIEGSFAEVGVYRGTTSAFLHLCAPSRTLYLFDSFSGFQDGGDQRFRDTNITLVRKRVGGSNNVHIRPGFFPATAVGLEAERFALVLLDVDKHDATLAGLDFFYARLVRGGYCFLHDYNNDESERGVSRAAHAFLKGRAELLIECADNWGTAMFRKT
jgi:O-methyltransferase